MKMYVSKCIVSTHEQWQPAEPFFFWGGGGDLSSFWPTSPPSPPSPPPPPPPPRFLGTPLTFLLSTVGSTPTLYMWPQTGHFVHNIILILRCSKLVHGRNNVPCNARAPTDSRAKSRVDNNATRL